MDNQRIGQRGELLAQQAAVRHGWQAWRLNMPIAGFEADVVCRREREGRREALILEVKTSENREPPPERVRARQRQKLAVMAEALAEVEGFDSVELGIVLVSIGRNAESVRWLSLDPF